MICPYCYTDCSDHPDYCEGCREIISPNINEELEKIFLVSKFYLQALVNNPCKKIFLVSDIDEYGRNVMYLHLFMKHSNNPASDSLFIYIHEEVAYYYFYKYSVFSSQITNDYINEFRRIWPETVIGFGRSLQINSVGSISIETVCKLLEREYY